MDENATRLAAANLVLGSFSDSRIERRRGGWYVMWAGRRGKIAKRWCCSGQDFYPVWARKWAHGGTACTALSQLIRWLRGQPVLPLASWRFWTSDQMKLLPMSAVTELQAAGYPTVARCVLCKRELTRGLDWWHLDGVSGPCCSMWSGCRQQAAGKAEG